MMHAAGNIREAQQPVPVQENRALCGKAQKIFASIVVAAHPTTIWLNICRVSTFFKDELFSLVERVKISIGFSSWEKYSDRKVYFYSAATEKQLQEAYLPKFLYRLPRDWSIKARYEQIGQEEGANKLERLTEAPGYNGPTFAVFYRVGVRFFPNARRFDFPEYSRECIWDGSNPPLMA